MGERRTGHLSQHESWWIAPTERPVEPCCGKVGELRMLACDALVRCGAALMFGAGCGTGAGACALVLAVCSVAVGLAAGVAPGF